MYSKGTWKQGLSQLDPKERWALLESELVAERAFLEEVVGNLCKRSSSGFVECRDLDVSCVCKRWARLPHFLASQIRCTATAGGSVRTFSWKIPRSPTSRPIVRPRTNVPYTPPSDDATLSWRREGRR